LPPIRDVLASGARGNNRTSIVELPSPTHLTASRIRRVGVRARREILVAGRTPCCRTGHDSWLTGIVNAASFPVRFPTTNWPHPGNRRPVNFGGGPAAHVGIELRRSTADPFNAILCPCRFDRLPLHVGRIVSPTTCERSNVIDHVPWSSMRIGSKELALRVDRSLLNAGLCGKPTGEVTSDLRVHTPRGASYWTLTVPIMPGWIAQ
jgi:hypothetical protein